eukprot:3689649-Pyramimonas_sp.AAC.1
MHSLRICLQQNERSQKLFQRLGGRGYLLDLCGPSRAGQAGTARPIPAHARRPELQLTSWIKRTDRAHYVGQS